MRTRISTWLYASIPLVAAQGSQQSGASSRATQSTHSPSEQASQYPQFPYSPDSSSISASPASVPSRTAPASTLSFSYSWASTFSQQTGAAVSSGYATPKYAPTTTPPLIHERDCGGTTVNVRSASYDWWYDEFIYDGIYTLSYEHNEDGAYTGWTIQTPEIRTDPLITSELSCDPEATTATATFPNATFTMPGLSCSVVQRSNAPVTASVVQTAYTLPTPQSGTGFPPRVWSQPPVATTAIGNQSVEFGESFVYFDNYEIESSNFTSISSHLGICNTVTQTYNLSEPYLFSYTGDSPQAATPRVSRVVDELDPAFPAFIGQPSITAGAFTATPTVIYVIREVIAGKVVVGALLRTAQSATKLIVPTPILPAGVSTDKDNEGRDVYTSLVAIFTAHLENSGQALITPPPLTTTTTTQPDVVVQSIIVLNAPSSSPVITPLVPAWIGAIIMQGLGATPTSTPDIGAAGQTLRRNTITAVVVDGQTAIPGGSAITISGTPVQVPAKGNLLVIGDSTMDIPTGATTIGGMSITEAPATIFTGAGQTLVPGGPAITISGTPVSLVPGGGALIVGSSTSLLENRLITLGSQTFTADASSQFVIAGTTLSPGGTAVISGTTLVLQPGATGVIINGHTSGIKPSAPSPAVTQNPALTVDGQIIVPSSSYWVISGKTLTLGGAVTYTNGNAQLETVSLDAAGSMIMNVIAGKTTTAKVSTATIPVIVVNGHTYVAQASSGSTYVIEGHTLTNGGVETVIVDGSTFALTLAATPTAVSIRRIDGTATTTESLWTPAGGTASTTASTTDSSGATLRGDAASITAEVLSVVAAGSVLAFAIWL